MVVRDPIDRAYSNWMHLWVDGLEPIGDFVAAWHAEDERVAAGWAPFWHYRRLGRNSRRFVAPGLRTSVIGGAIRAGAAAGRLFPPQVWRRASGPLLVALQFRGPRQRPKLAAEQRSALLGDCADDIALLEEVLGESFQDWHSGTGRGSFVERVATS